MATEADKVNTGVLATLVAVSSISLVGVTLAITALARDQMSIEATEKESRAGAQHEKLRSEQLQKLRSGVPIEEAMRKVVADLARDPQSATPGSAPAAGASPGGAPAPSATPATPTEGRTGAIAPSPGPDKDAQKAARRPAGAPAAPSPAAPSPAAPSPQGGAETPPAP